MTVSGSPASGRTPRTSGTQIHIHSTTASQWFINHQGTEAVTYAHIENSGCDGTSTTITVSDGISTNGGNNGACWSFGGTTYVPRPSGYPSIY